MKPVTLNLASRPFRNNVLVGSLLTVVGLGLVSATAYNLYVYLGYGSAYARLQQEQTEDRARIVEKQAEERQLGEEVRRRDFRHAYERGKLASEMVRQSAFSWTQLFNTLEAVVPPDVVMTAIRPNISSESIVLRIEGVAKNPLAFRSFQERLLKNPLFTRVFPASERRLNPSLPDVTFLLTCDYLPQAPPAAGLVAGKQDAGAAAPAATEAAASAATGAAAASGTTGTATSQAAGGTAPAGGAAAGGGKGAGRTAHNTAGAGMVVGRDGQAVDNVMATVLAPGALYTPLVPAGTQPKQSKKGGKPSPASADTGTKKAAPPAKTDENRAAGTKPAAGVKPAAGTKPLAGAATGAQTEAGHDATEATTPSRTSPDGRKWDPNVPRTMPMQQRAALANRPKAPEQAVAATRLDVPLSFAAAPVRDVYDRLAQAHGVRFEFGPGVDLASPVTLNLQGRRLEDALALVTLQTRHHVTRKADGVYRVDGSEAGRALTNAPVIEEPIGGEAP